MRIRSSIIDLISKTFEILSSVDQMEKSIENCYSNTFTIIFLI